MGGDRAGAVDQHVAPPEAAGDLAYEQRDAAGRAEVALHRERLPTYLPCPLHGLDRRDGLVRGLQVTEGQRVARLGEPQRDGLTDPARRSCYDRDAPARSCRLRHGKLRPNAANMMSAIRSAISSSGSRTSALIR